MPAGLQNRENESICEKIEKESTTAKYTGQEDRNYASMVPRLAAKNNYERLIVQI